MGTQGDPSRFGRISPGSRLPESEVTGGEDALQGFGDAVRISSQRQVEIPERQLAEAGLYANDAVTIRALGVRQLLVTSARKAAAGEEAMEPSDGAVRISDGRCLELPEQPFAEAGLDTKETVVVRASGPGQLLITSLKSLLDRYRGSLPAGTYPQDWLQKLREDWPQ